MSASRAILPTLFGVAARRTLLLWAALRGVAWAQLSFEGRTQAEFPAMFWSPITGLWVLIVGVLLLFVMEAQRWRETVLLGNLGLPRYTVVAMASAVLLLLELALHAARP